MSLPVVVQQGRQGVKGPLGWLQLTVCHTDAQGRNCGADAGRHGGLRHLGEAHPHLTTQSLAGKGVHTHVEGHPAATFHHCQTWSSEQRTQSDAST